MILIRLEFPHVHIWAESLLPCRKRFSWQGLARCRSEKAWLIVEQRTKVDLGEHMSIETQRERKSDERSWRGLTVDWMATSLCNSSYIVELVEHRWTYLDLGEWAKRLVLAARSNRSLLIVPLSPVPLNIRRRNRRSVSGRVSMSWRLTLHGTPTVDVSTLVFVINHQWSVSRWDTRIDGYQWLYIVSH